MGQDRQCTHINAGDASVQSERCLSTAIYDQDTQCTLYGNKQCPLEWRWIHFRASERGIPLGQTMRTSVERHCTVSAANNVYISGDGSEWERHSLLCAASKWSSKIMYTMQWRYWMGTSSNTRRVLKAWHQSLRPSKLLLNMAFMCCALIMRLVLWLK